jgi:hypothetical protein
MARKHWSTRKAGGASFRRSVIAIGLYVVALLSGANVLSSCTLPGAHVKPLNPVSNAHDLAVYSGGHASGRHRPGAGC